MVQLVTDDGGTEAVALTAAALALLDAGVPLLRLAYGAVARVTEQGVVELDPTAEEAAEGGVIATVACSKEDVLTVRRAVLMTCWSQQTLDGLVLGCIEAKFSK